MDTQKLEKWADLLLDTGKRNNLINFKDSKHGTAEIVAPEYAAVFSKAEHGAVFEVYDPKTESGDDDGDGEETENSLLSYIEAYAGKLKKNQILLYNAYGNHISALKNVGKRARTAIEETGVNIAYLAFGFIHWTESESSRQEMRAPVLLAPVAIENQSAIEPYRIRVMDDEIIVNPTFTFKLQTEYGVKLPEYDEDEGIESYLDTVSALLGRLGWTVSRECKIGIFSFLKINMYKDIKENLPKIAQSVNVRALLGEGEDDVGDTVEKYDVNCLHNVVNADSSQAEAIETAKEGVSFVLQGPPGTGKSQTITNIIAECLADGKKVLFVSEKLAALNVVHDKLKKAGLEEFCLEIHSHKANKKQVIDELYKTLMLPKSGVADKAEKELKIKLELMNKLDAYAAELHKKRGGINKTLYAMYEEVSANRGADDVCFVIKDVKQKGESYIDEAERLLKSYAAYVPSVGADYHKNAWYGYVNTDSSYPVVMQLKEDMNGVIALCRRLVQTDAENRAETGVTASCISQAIAVKRFYGLAAKSNFITPSLLKGEVLKNVKAKVARLKGIAEEVIKCRNGLDACFDKEIYALDGQTLYKKLVGKYGGRLARLFGGEYRRIINGFRLCKKDGKKLKYKKAAEAAQTLKTYQENIRLFEGSETEVKHLLGAGYVGVNTNFEALISELETVGDTLLRCPSLGVLSQMPQDTFALKKQIFGRFSAEYDRAFRECGERLERLASGFDKNEYNIFRAPCGALITKLCACLGDTENLDNWCDFVRLLKRLGEHGLRGFVDTAIKENVKSDKVAATYKKAFYLQWIDAVLHESPILTELARVHHDEAIERFREKDILDFEINKAKIKAKLSALRPHTDLVAPGSAIAVLLREREKKRKKKGIRQLLSEIGELAQTLKPCFLMSPLSVSTFLSPETKFDAVIFDEASQIFPQDAIGAIYRGSQLIVVGDCKQMPPSNFFNSSVDGDGDEENEDISDFESILDLCSTAFPQRRLKWHYRSRYEQLISFSNKNFYDNDLVTFPSPKPDAEGAGVDYFYVDGTFDRRSKTNRAEAERVADLVFENIGKYPERSLGVVAFSISQQNLIEKIIYKRRQQNPAFEEFFRTDRAEPFFIKNLETVQGDERDTIIFSIAYAKDADGRLLMNFGPINREGGERRLNVAVTRAKYNVRLVSSMHCYDIDLARTSSVGARLLREYLDYAENGILALRRSVRAENPFEGYDSEFEEEVCEFLRENGFAADTQVGCSSFRIDLALKRPDSSDYALAIECDGASYHSSKTARDRDRLRQEILEGMGWKFYRVWSTDWFRSKKTEKQRLLEAAKRAIDNYPVKNYNGKTVRPKEDGEVFSEIVKEKEFEFPKYKLVDARAVAAKKKGNAGSVICAIVEAESPVSEEWLLKRLVFIFGGREKVTNVVRTQFLQTMRYCARFGIARKDGFVYVSGTKTPMLRVPEKGSEPREIKYIETGELANGLREILRQNIYAEKTGLFKLLSQTLGFSRMTDTVAARMESALGLLSDEIETNGDMLSLK